MKESSCNIQIPVSHRTSYFWSPFPITKKIVFANISRFYQLCFNFRAQGYKVQLVHLWINRKSVKKDHKNRSCSSEKRKITAN